MMISRLHIKEVGRRLMPLFFLFLVSAQLSAQQYACFSYQKVLTSMPDYHAAMDKVKDMRSQYEAETKRMESDFNSKYEDFLEVQSTLDTTIRSKRQLELQELIAKGDDFRNKASRLLADKEKELIAHVRERLQQIIAQLSHDNGYAFVLNTDDNAVPFADATLCPDITSLLIDKVAF